MNQKCIVTVKASGLTRPGVIYPAGLYIGFVGNEANKPLAPFPKLLLGGELPGWAHGPYDVNDPRFTVESEEPVGC